MKNSEVFKAEMMKYLGEVKTYYPDQIVSVTITVFLFVVFSFMSNVRDNPSFYIGFVYWFLISSLISEAAVSTSSEKQMGILDQLMIQPASFKKIILHRTFVWQIFHLVKVLIAMLVLKLILNFPIAFHLGILPIFFMTSFGLLGFTLFLCALTLKYTKIASFESIVSYILMILTGTIFPLSMLPSGLRVLGECLPISQGIQLSKNLLQGKSIELIEICILFLTSILYFVLGFVLFNLVYESSKKSGLDRHY